MTCTCSLCARLHAHASVQVRVKYVVTRDASTDEITRARAADPWVRVRESPEQYAAETAPKLPARKLAAAWVREIIDGSKPDEDVLVREPDWVLVRDSKKCHDPHKPEDAYYIALFEDASLGSLRDLRAEHLPLLRRVLSEAPAAVHERLAAAETEAPLPQLVCYVQYEPLYWYLHVHVVSVQHKMFTEWTGSNLALMALDRWHTLEDVIERLELRGDYYAHAQLPCLVKRAGTAEPPQASGTGCGAATTLHAPPSRAS